MPRPLSSNTRKVLTHLGKSPKSMDELAARTGIRKERVAKVLWHLEQLGWVQQTEEIRKLPVYRRLRDLPAAKPQVGRGASSAPHIAALNAAFGIRTPAKRARGRIVRQSE